MTKRSSGGRTEPVLGQVPIGDRDQAQPPKGSFWEAIQKLREVFDFEELSIDPEEIFKGVRDSSPGRDIDL